METSKLCVSIKFGYDYRGTITHISGAPFDGNNYLLNTVDGWQEGYWVPQSKSETHDGVEYDGFHWMLCNDTMMEHNAVSHYAPLPEDIDSDSVVQGFLSGIRSAASMLFYKACNTWKPQGHSLSEVCKEEARFLDELAESVLEMEPTEYAKWKDINALSAEVENLRKWRTMIVKMSNEHDTDFYENDPEATILDLISHHVR